MFAANRPTKQWQKQFINVITAWKLTSVLWENMLNEKIRESPGKRNAKNLSPTTTATRSWIPPWTRKTSKLQPQIGWIAIVLIKLIACKINHGALWLASCQYCAYSRLWMQSELTNSPRQIGTTLYSTYSWKDGAANSALPILLQRLETNARRNLGIGPFYMA